MNAAQKVSVREALEAWSDVADITFVEVDESASDSVVGTMRFGFTTQRFNAKRWWLGEWAWRWKCKW